jgi:hypothetical protein
VAAARQTPDTRHADAIREEGCTLSLVEAIEYGLAEEHASAAPTHDT